MAGLAIEERIETGFRPAGRGTAPANARMSSNTAPEISKFASATAGLVAVGFASACAAGIFAFGRDVFRPTEEPVDHYRFISDSLAPSGPTMAVAGRIMDEKPHGELSKTPSWDKLAETVGWIREASARIDRLAGRPDGWKGAGSVRASVAAVSDTFVFLEKLQIELPKAAPMISLDEDGEFILFWKDDKILASVSIAGDETYTFFGTNGGEDVIREAVPLASPFPLELLSILSIRSAPDNYA